MKIKTIKRTDNLADKHTDNLAEITDNAFEYAKLTCEQEEKRENSLINQATQMTTYFSFVSVLVLMIIPIIITKEEYIPNNYIIIISIITLLALFVSMVFAVIAQWRFKYKALSSPMTMFDHIIENRDYFQTKEQRNKSFIQSLESFWSSKRKNNDVRASLIKISMSIFFGAIGFLIAATTFGIVAFIIV